MLHLLTNLILVLHVVVVHQVTQNGSTQDHTRDHILVVQREIIEVLLIDMTTGIANVTVQIVGIEEEAVGMIILEIREITDEMISSIDEDVVGDLTDLTAEVCLEVQ